MSATDRFFVDSHLLLYYVDPADSRKQNGATEAHWMPVDTILGLLQQAWHWVDSAQLPYWDALILAAARRSGARYLPSEFAL